MDSSHLLGLLIPAIAGIFCVTFCTLWYSQKTLKYLLNVSLGFGLIGLGFVLKQALITTNSTLSLIAASACYVTAICLLISAGGQRRQNKPSKRFLVALGVFGATAIILTGISFDDMSHRSMLHNCILGSLFLMGGLGLSRAEKPDFLDRLFLRALLGVGLTFGLITLTIYATPSQLTAATYYSSTYWFLMNVAISVSLLVLAMTIFAMAAVDLMTRVKEEAETDLLSGLLIRSAYAREVAALATRSQLASGLILFDLDHFKQVNDKYGHSVGDEVIRAVGHLVTDRAPPGSICGRLGGEEFGIVLPGLPLQATRLFAERLRLAIMALEIEELVNDKPISASFGITLHNHNCAFERAYKNADTALYAAKQSGRNTVKQALKDVA